MQKKIAGGNYSNTHSHTDTNSEELGARSKDHN